MRIRYLAACLTAVALGASSVAHSAPGDVDPGFIPPTIFSAFSGVASVNATVVQPNGQVVIGGTFTALDGAAQISLARLNADGSRDLGFASPFVTDTTVNTLALQQDGRILVGGAFVTPTGQSNLTRVNADGSLDPSFHPPPNVIGIVNKVVVRGDGIILCAGNFSGVIALNPDGSFFDPAIPAYGRFFTPVRGFVPDAGGTLIAGDATLAGYAILTRIDGADHQDLSFHVPVVQDNSIINVERQDDGSLFIAGRFSIVDSTTRKLAARVTSAGVLDATFDLGNALGEIGPVKTQADGKIVAGGYFRPASEAYNYGFARLNADGSFDSTFQVRPPVRNANGRVGSIQLLSDGRILIAGNFTTVNGIPRTLIARLLVTDDAPPVLSTVTVTPSTVNENGTVTLSGNISDVDVADTFSLTVDWGDGSPPQTFKYPAGTTSFGETHRYLNDDPSGTSSDAYAITLSLADSAGGTAALATSVTVNNVAPTLSGILVSPAAILIGGSTTVTGTVNDIGTLDSHTVAINWGDGSANATINLAAGATAFSISHSYASAGNFTIALGAADDDTGSVGASAGVAVTQPASPPAAPGGLVATAVSPVRIDLAWVDTSGNESGFRIERCRSKNCKNFVEIGQTGANSAAYSDAGLARRTQYQYRIRAFNATGSSAYSNLATAKTLRK